MFSSPFYGLFPSKLCAQVFFFLFFWCFPGAVKCFFFGFGGLLLSSYVVAQSTCVGSFVRDCEFLIMLTMQPTFNSLSADLFPTPSTSAPPSSGDSMAVSTVALGTSNSLLNEVALLWPKRFNSPCQPSSQRFVQRISPPCYLVRPFEPVSSVVVSSSAMVAASSLSSVAVTLRLPPFVSTFPAISSTPGSCLARLAQSIAAPIMASQVTSFSSHSESLAASCDKALEVGPGHAPILAKLVKKISSGEFVELANLLSTNLCAVDLGAPVIFGWKTSGLQKVSAG